MKNFRKVTLTAITVVMLVLCFAASASAYISTGSCGQNVNWSFDTVTGELVVSGSGPMKDYGSYNRVFRNYKIKTITVNEGVTSVGNHAFRECADLEKVVLSDSVTSIGNCAFESCSKLSEIIMPDSVEFTGYRALAGTAWYKNQPDGMVYAGKVLYDYKGDAFKNSRVVVKAGTKLIGHMAFYNVKNIVSVELPDTVKRISPLAFAYCKDLKTVNIPQGVSVIEKQTFYRCSALEKITVPSTVTEIRDTAFASCSSLKTVKLNFGLKTLGKKVFSQCVSLESVNLPNSVSSIGIDLFRNCDSLRSVTLPAGLTEIVYGMFYDCDSLEGVSIPFGVEKIGDQAFRGCDRLENITFPETVKEIGIDAFRWCKSFVNIIIPEGVKSIRSEAFSYCKRLRGISLPRSLTMLTRNFIANSDICVIFCKKGSDAAAYSELYKLRYVCTDADDESSIFKGKVGKYEWSLDKRTGVLKLAGSGNLPDFATKAPPWYEHRYFIRHISLPEGVTRIGANAFRDCYRITSVIFPESVTKIGYSAFENCTSLAYVKIPKNVKTIENSAFMRCEYLKKVYICHGVEEINYSAFADCNRLASVKIPGTVKMISTSAFRGCEKLSNVEIGNGVKVICPTVFYGCKSLETITFPYTVTEIMEHSFNRCDNLKGITFYSKKCKFDINCGLNYDHTVYAFKGSSAESFADRMGANFVDVETVHNHSFSKKVTRATLADNGKVVESCSVCGKKVTTVIYSPETIRLSKTSYTADGKIKTPSVTVKDVKGKTLKKDVDYTVKYASGRKLPGKYAVKVTFDGLYEGSKTLYFTIKK